MSRIRTLKVVCIVSHLNSSSCIYLSLFSSCHGFFCCSLFLCLWAVFAFFPLRPTCSLYVWSSSHAKFILCLLNSLRIARVFSTPAALPPSPYRSPRLECLIVSSWPQGLVQLRSALSRLATILCQDIDRKYRKIGTHRPWNIVTCLPISNRIVPSLGLPS